MRYEIKKSCQYETRAGESFLMQTPPERYREIESVTCLFLPEVIESHLISLTDFTLL